MQKFPRVLFCFFCFTVFLILSFPTWAWTTKPLTLEQMVSLSDRVFQGRVTDVRYDNDFESGTMVKYITFEVASGDCLKGSCEGSVVVKQLAEGPTTRDILAGNSYVVFYPADSNLGLVAPLGFNQGLLQVDETASRPTLPALKHNPLFRKSLLKNSTKSLTGNVADLSTFKARVKQLVDGGAGE